METNPFALLVLPLDERVMDESIKNAHQRIFVFSKEVHCQLARNPVDTWKKTNPTLTLGLLDGRE